ncbi:putative transcription factor cys6 protein [Botrytis fragariae]|uniref:Putative transcription factor cys6 protein n=1 Tax=Botrytis fragariae TaxID=1964551 RepID=A0A8H6ANU6_9HELO|nr:putative transcription factor cys6 protein [Botrytis fragariae]KAF5870640.1 putative transcription factor cys6 protein [Botrytis fragariae]
MTDSTETERSGPYGRACLNCAKAKTKCNFGSDQRICERCGRLKKGCVTAPVKRRQKPRVTAERLEQRLDGLVSLLRTISPNNPAVENALNSFTVRPSDKHASDLHSTAVNNSARDSDEVAPTDSGAAHLPPTPASSATPTYPYTLPEGAEPTIEEAEICFHSFCTKNLPHFPFIQFQDGMTARQLRQERPFFWLCIMTMSSTVIRRQITLGKTIREIAARELVVEGKRNLDLLLGLVCFVGWGQYQVRTAPFMTLFSNFIVTLVIDLQLHQPTSDEAHTLGLEHEFRHQETMEVPLTRNMEHRRLVIACYYLTSTLSTFHKKLEGVVWCPYLDKCLSKLEERKDPSDELLINQVRLQQVVRKTVESYINLIRDGTPDQPGSSTLIMLYIQTLKSQLAEVKKKIPSHLNENRVLNLQIYGAEVMIHEFAIYLPNSTEASSIDSSLSRIESLHCCLNAIKAWFDILLNCPASYFIGLSLPVWKQFGGVFFPLYRLTVLKDPAWDTDMVRRVCAPGRILDVLGQSLKESEAEAAWERTSSDSESIFTCSEKVMKMFKAWVDRKPGFNAPITITSNSIDDFQEKQQQPMSETDQMASMSAFMPMEMEDIWSQDYMGLWDMYPNSF